MQRDIANFLASGKNYFYTIRRDQVDSMVNGPDRPTFSSNQNNILFLFNVPDRPKISLIQKNNNILIEKRKAVPQRFLGMAISYQ